MQSCQRPISFSPRKRKLFFPNWGKNLFDLRISLDDRFLPPIHLRIGFLFLLISSGKRSTTRSKYLSSLRATRYSSNVFSQRILVNYYHYPRVTGALDYNLYDSPIPSGQSFLFPNQHAVEIILKIYNPLSTRI